MKNIRCEKAYLPKGFLRSSPECLIAKINITYTNKVIHFRNAKNEEEAETTDLFEIQNLRTIHHLSCWAAHHSAQKHLKSL